VAGLAVLYTGWAWLDPAVSIAIVAFIMLGTWSLLREALHMMLAAVPASVDAPRVEQFLRDSANVS
jgi:cobalt-zinc-cadmium efflux system protein